MLVHAVPAFQDNYLWVIAEGARAAVVDPGDAAPIERFLEAKGLQQALMDQFPELSRTLLKQLCKRLREVEQTHSH